MHDSIMVPNAAYNAKGGTELMAERLSSLPSRLLDKTQVWMSRFDGQLVDPSRAQVLVMHDVPNDPMYFYLKNGGHSRFDLIVCVSHWQRQMAELMLGIPPSKMTVMLNAIQTFDPVERRKFKRLDGYVHVVYHSTPHRGLDILADVFSQIVEDDPYVKLHVYSSFKLYGQEQRDEKYLPLFKRLEDTKNTVMYGTRSNDEVRLALQRAHIFAYPSTWPETSCLCLIEAMCAGTLCVHPSLAALPETAMNFTRMYDYTEDRDHHVATFDAYLREAIAGARSGEEVVDREKVKIANQVYDWHWRRDEWINLLTGLTS